MLSTASLLVTLLANVGSTLMAPTDLVDATNAPRVAEVIQSMGYRAQMDTDGVGDPMIQSSATGSRFVIYFYGCTDNKDCKAIQFAAGFALEDGIAPELINSWNKDNRYGKAYIDAENDPIIEMDVNLEGGVSTSNMKRQMSLWEITLGEFKAHIGQ